MTDTATRTGSSHKEGPVRLCSKCQVNVRSARGSWCRDCRNEAQRDYNTRTRNRPVEKSAECVICGTTMTWISGRGPDRVHCSTRCKRKADGVIQTVRRRAKVDPARRAEIAERTALHAQGVRRCNICGEVKPLDGFHFRGSGWQHRCIACTADYGRANERTVRIHSWISHLKTKFGLSYDQWMRMLVAQAGRCAICNDPMREPHVDHDHTHCGPDAGCPTCVRELLCGTCNAMIGMSREDPMILQAAIVYLQRNAIQVPV